MLHIMGYTHDLYLTETGSQGNLGRTSKIILVTQSHEEGATLTF